MSDPVVSSEKPGSNFTRVALGAFVALMFIVLVGLVVTHKPAEVVSAPAVVVPVVVPVEPVLAVPVEPALVVPAPEVQVPAELVEPVSAPVAE